MDCGFSLQSFDVNLLADLKCNYQDIACEDRLSVWPSLDSGVLIVK